MRKRKGFTYLVHAENLDRFKIGCAVDYIRRLKELQTSSPVKLHLIAKKKSNDMHTEEKKWHSLFKSKRKNGEWFQLDYKEIVKVTKSWRTDIGIHWRVVSIFEKFTGCFSNPPHSFEIPSLTS